MGPRILWERTYARCQWCGAMFDKYHDEASEDLVVRQRERWRAEHRVTCVGLIDAGCSSDVPLPPGAKVMATATPVPSLDERDLVTLAYHAALAMHHYLIEARVGAFSAEQGAVQSYETYIPVWNGEHWRIWREVYINTLKNVAAGLYAV